MSWGLGVVLLKRYALKMPTTMLTGWTMLIGALPICVAALLLESGQWRAVGFWPAFGLAYNVVVAFMFCYWAWNRIVLMVPVAVSSLSSLVTPVIGVIGRHVAPRRAAGLERIPRRRPDPRRTGHRAAAAAEVTGPGGRQSGALQRRSPSSASSRTTSPSITRPPGG